MTGDRNDILQRLRSTLPPWFGDSPPVVEGILSGLAAAWVFVYGLIHYAVLQTRIKTATDSFLDLIANDFFGITFRRKDNEPDERFRGRIIANLFRERATRKALRLVLETLTDRTPLIFEPKRPLDTGAYSGGYIGYGRVGGYGSVLLPRQCFVVAYRPLSSGIPWVAGYGISTGGYSQPSRGEYATIGMIRGAVQDEDIYAAIDSVKPAGTIVWTRIDS